MKKKKKGIFGGMGREGEKGEKKKKKKRESSCPPRNKIRWLPHGFYSHFVTSIPYIMCKGFIGHLVV